MNKKSISSLISPDRVLCRLFASWCIYTAFTLDYDADYTVVTFGRDYPLYIMLLWIAVGFAAMSLLAFFLRSLHTDSWLLLMASTVCATGWCMIHPGGASAPMLWLAAGTVYAMILIWTIHVNKEWMSRISVGKVGVIIFSAVFAVIACGVLSVITCQRYRSFTAPNFDFGIFVNMFHNMKETGLPLVTCERDRLLSHFAVHLSPTWYLLLPFYMLFPSPYTLQIGQAVIVMIGVLPLVLLCRHYRLSGRATVAMTGLYAFYTAISAGGFYDIHENCFLAPLLLLTFLFFERQKPVPMYICALLTLGVKEDAAVYLLLFALYIFFGRKRYLRGTALAVLSVGYFAFAVFLMRKYGLGIMSDRYSNLMADPEAGLIGVLSTFLRSPGYVLTQLFTTSSGGAGKLIYLLQLLLPVGFLPLCTKKASRFLLCAPLLLNLLTMYPYQYEIGFQYGYGITAFLFYASVMNLPELSHSTRSSIVAVAAAFSVCLYSMVVVSELGYYVKSGMEWREHHARLEEIVDTVPDNVSVAASCFLLPHLAQRSVIYQVEEHGGLCDIDYVVLDARYAEYTKFAEPYIEHGYTEIFYEEGMILILVSPAISGN